MASQGWDNSHPLKFKCTFCDAYFKIDKERQKHQEEIYSDF